jgi:integrase
MLHVAFAGGLRVSDPVGLCLDDWTYSPQPCLFVRGKGRKERALPPWKETASALQVWLSVRGYASVPALFLNARGEQLTLWGFDHILRKYLKTAARCCPSLLNKRITPHVLRHTCTMTICRQRTTFERCRFGLVMPVFKQARSTPELIPWKNLMLLPPLPHLHFVGVPSNLRKG